MSNRAAKKKSKKPEFKSFFPDSIPNQVDLGSSTIDQVRKRLAQGVKS